MPSPSTVLAHPVQLRVEVPSQMARVHVAIRLILLAALSTIGCTSLYWVLYLALPAMVALLIAQKGGARYLAEDTPRIERALRWLAAAYAYLWLLTDDVPTRLDGSGAVELVVQPGGQPTSASALWKLISSVPAALLLVLLSLAGMLLWLVGAGAVLVRRRLPGFVAAFLVQVLAYQVRLAAYHLSLVDAYPSMDAAAEARVPA
jgi:hypothetical protein